MKKISFSRIAKVLSEKEMKHVKGGCGDDSGCCDFSKGGGTWGYCGGQSTCACDSHRQCYGACGC